MGGRWICGNADGFVPDGRAGLCMRKGGRAYVHFADGGGIGTTDEVCRGSFTGGFRVLGQ